MTGFSNGFQGGFGNNSLFNIGGSFIAIMFILFLGVFIFAIATAINQGVKNSQSPVLTVEAKVVTKRTDVTYHSDMNTNDGFNTSSSSTWHYVTFEVESGDRMEFSVMGNEYGMLVEGDKGRLTFQGTRYKGFERQI